MGRRHEQEDDFLKKPLDFSEVLEKDEQETRYDTVIKHRKKLKIRKKRLKVIVLFLVVVSFSAYFFTSASSIKIVKVRNNVVYTQAEILEKAKLDYGDKILLHPGFFAEAELEKDPLIKSVRVEKNYLSGAIYINVEEETLVGNYQEEGKFYVLLANGESIESKLNSAAVLNTPFISDLTKEQRMDLAKAFKKLKQKDVALISEIRHYAESYDANMVELLMNDGYIVRSDYASIHLLAYYKGIKKGKTTDASMRCIELISEADASATKHCD